MKRILWCSGWGICPRELEEIVSQKWKEFNHKIMVPHAHMIEELESYDFKEVKGIVGYSLGACRMLHYWERLKHIQVEKIVLAPFLDLKISSRLGGKVDPVQLLYLKRMLKRDSLNALQDFYKRAGICLKFPEKLPYSLEDLIWGINYLLENTITPDAYFSEVQGIIGAQDALIDSHCIKDHLQEMHIESSATHCISSLLPYLKQKWI